MPPFDVWHVSRPRGEKTPIHDDSDRRGRMLGPRSAATGPVDKDKRSLKERKLTAGKKRKEIQRHAQCMKDTEIVPLVHSEH